MQICVFFGGYPRKILSAIVYQRITACATTENMNRMRAHRFVWIRNSNDSNDLWRIRSSAIWCKIGTPSRQKSQETIDLFPEKGYIVLMKRG